MAVVTVFAAHMKIALTVAFVLALVVAWLSQTRPPDGTPERRHLGRRISDSLRTMALAIVVIAVAGGFFAIQDQQHQNARQQAALEVQAEENVAQTDGLIEQGRAIERRYYAMRKLMCAVAGAVNSNAQVLENLVRAPPNLPRDQQALAGLARTGRFLDNARCGAAP